MSDDPKQARVWEIIDTAIADLKAVGADHRNACALLAIQAMVRLDLDIPAELATLGDILAFAQREWEDGSQPAAEEVN